ncbi:MAG: hypothetical protein WEB00_09940 [Dehalococcoidia bacterium]
MAAAADISCVIDVPRIVFSGWRLKSATSSRDIGSGERTAALRARD